jgi:phage-related minor tail protein
MEDQFTVAINADTSGFETALETLEKQSSKLGDTLAGALKKAVVSGQSLDDILRSIATNLATSALSAGLKPLQNMVNGLGSSLFSALSPVTPFATGGVLAGAGGVVSAPSYFPMAGGAGLMGEAGPEAIMPLSRGSDGRLGVAASGGSQTHVSVTIQANDPTAFRRSEAQISGAITRAVARGQRSN